jgi:Flp pilus assembly protein CpaB
VAGALAALAVTLALDVLQPPPDPTADVVVAARDLTAGSAVAAEDVRVAGLPPPVVPDGALVDTTLVVGRTLAAPVRAGEPVTDVRLLGPRVVDGYGPGLVGTPVRLADAGVARLLGTGDLVDVLAAPTADPLDQTSSVQPASVVAAGVRVVLVEPPSEAAALDAGGLVVLATTPGQAAELAGAAAGAVLSVRLRPD